jgi:hypothetical protein
MVDRDIVESNVFCRRVRSLIEGMGECLVADRQNFEFADQSIERSIPGPQRLPARKDRTWLVSWAPDCSVMRGLDQARHLLVVGDYPA